VMIASRSSSAPMGGDPSRNSTPSDANLKSSDTASHTDCLLLPYELGNQFGETAWRGLKN
jgi:hypothetical protein